MEIKLFSDLIDCFGKVLSAVKAVAQLSKADRARYREVMDETYRLVDTTLNMVIVRLGDILAPEMAPNFMVEVGMLGNYAEWIRAEREFRLCKSLRIAVRESERLTSVFLGRISTADWEALLSQMRSVLASEGEIANYLSTWFNQLAKAANQNATPSEITQQIQQVRSALIVERQRLIQQEIELYSLV